ncbi:MAG: YqfO family protein [Victivallales bacterium]|nr:YqfO family protein [Victivallales bacterium]
MASFYKFEFYVPREHLESVKEAVFDAGAGRIGTYGKCSWETPGTGQFMPLEGSDPFIGRQDSLERVEEIKVEMVCAHELIGAVVSALKAAHPYETPAYQYWEVHY